MNKIQLLSDNSHAVQVGGGVIWADLYRFLDPYNLTAVGTRNSLTGVVGSILGGKPCRVKFGKEYTTLYTYLVTRRNIVLLSAPWLVV